MDESQKLCTKWKKSNTEAYILLSFHLYDIQQNTTRPGCQGLE